MLSLECLPFVSLTSDTLILSLSSKKILPLATNQTNCQFVAMNIYSSWLLYLINDN